jgi:phosphate:Na+ symporter
VNETLNALIPLLMSALGGLGIFILGMKYMSEGMQAVAGN